MTGSTPVGPGSRWFFAPPCAGMDTELVAARSGFWNSPESEQAFRRELREDRHGMLVDVGSCIWVGRLDPCNGNQEETLNIALPCLMILQNMPPWELNGVWLSLLTLNSDEARRCPDITTHKGWKCLAGGWGGCLDAASSFIFDDDCSVVCGASTIKEPPGGLREDERMEVPPIESMNRQQVTMNAIMTMMEKRYRHSWRCCEEADWDPETFVRTKKWRRVE